MVTAALTTGMRVGELVALRWRSLLEQPVPMLLITERFYRGDFDVPKSAPKHSKDNRRKIVIDSETLSLLLEWRGRSRYTKPDDFIFHARGGGVLRNPQNITNRYIKPACRRLGLREAHWGIFRHTYQTWAQENNVPPRILADQVGHSDIGTQAIYIESSKDDVNVERITAGLHKSCTNDRQMELPIELQENWVN